MADEFTILIRLMLSCFLGGLIGIEREKNRHPAGFRTHILVCMGATLVMLSNFFIFEQFKGQTNIDPSRLGAQVISGIGFLGAGTILKEGISVKGLTTAASLWAVACVGLAVGIGFYEGAALTTSFVLITLVIFSRFEHLIYEKHSRTVIFTRASSRDIDMPRIYKVLDKYDITVSRIKLVNEKDDTVLIKISTTGIGNASMPQIVEEISKIEQISDVEVCE